MPVRLAGAGYSMLMTAKRRDRPTRAEYQRGRYDYHDPLGGFAGAAPTLSALTARLWLAGFGVVFCTITAWFAVRAELTGLAVVLVVLAVVGAVDFAWVLHRKRRGEPG